MGKYALNWDLDSLFPNPATGSFQQTVDAFRKDLKALAETSNALPAVSRVAATVQTWSTFFAEMERLEGLAGDLASFIGCHAAGDAGNKQIRQWEATLSALDPLREQVYTNVELLFKGASDADFQAFVAASPILARNRYFLDLRRRNAALRLPREQELLAADLAVDGLHAWGRLYDRLSSDLRVTVMEKGQLVEKSPGQIRFDMPERPVRENNFYAADKAWKSIADSCADSLNHISGHRLTVYRRLGLNDHLDVPLHRNRMSRATLDAMWGAISERKVMLLDYLAAKAKLIGVPRLAWYDLAAPLPQLAGSGDGESTEIGWDDACDLIIKTFGEFSPDFGGFAKHAFESKWVEAENRSGKRQGAFCTGIPTRKQTRVFMTYLNTYDNASTLAHELGHAYHSWVLRDEPLFLQDYPMNLAETASTFAETVLAEQRIQASKSSGERLRILDHMLADAVAFMMNIHARFVFEDNFHKERLNGELTAARLSELMLAAQKETYLNALAEDGWYPDFWVSKLHFYISGLPFYNFPYTFGYLLSTGLFALAAEFGDEFPDRYRKLLIATGCMDAEAAVQSTFGYDLSKPDFWHKSLDVIAARVQQFSQLVSAK
jgi:oligoendopeptidase F